MQVHAEQLHFDFLVRPEPGQDECPVTLWALRGVGSRQQLYASEPGSWLQHAQALQASGLLDSRRLGTADARISRGEPAVCSITCSLEDLLRSGLREVDAPAQTRAELLSTLSLREEIPVAAKHQPAAEMHPRFTPAFRHDSSAISRKAHVANQYRQLISATASPSRFTPESTVDEALSQRQSLALLGIRVDNISMAESVQAIDALIDMRVFHQIATANVDFLNKAYEDRELLDILHSCELVLPDGMPLVWASRMLGAPLRERVTGADLLPQLLELSAKKQRRIFMLGATEERSAEAARYIAQAYPGAVICGRYSPPFGPLDAMDNETIFRMLDETQPDILLVAFGNPKQEKWIYRHRDRLRVPVCIGVGASIDFLSGQQSRAPEWMQRSGTEWIYRIVREPRRLIGRYAGDGRFMLRHMSAQLFAHASQIMRADRSELRIFLNGQIPVVQAAGVMSAKMVQALPAELKAAHTSVIFDLTSSTYVEPSAAALLIELAQACHRAGKELWIVSGQQIQTSLRATFPANEPFQVALTVEDALRFTRSAVPQAQPGSHDTTSNLSRVA